MERIVSGRGALLNRLDKFRQRRNLRQKYLFAASVFSFLLITGLLSADYGTNAMMTGNRGIELFSLVNKQTYLEVTIFNQKVFINTQYINRDLKRLQGLLDNFTGF
jgi:hypothetical protein